MAQVIDVRRRMVGVVGESDSPLPSAAEEQRADSWALDAVVNDEVRRERRARLAALRRKPS